MRTLPVIVGCLFLLSGCIPPSGSVAYADYPPPRHEVRPVPKPAPRPTPPAPRPGVRRPAQAPRPDRHVEPSRPGMPSRMESPAVHRAPAVQKGDHRPLPDRRDDGKDKRRPR